MVCFAQCLKVCAFSSMLTEAVIPGTRELGIQLHLLVSCSLCEPLY